MLKTANTLLAAFGLFLAPTLIAGGISAPAPKSTCTAAVPCKTPEPGPVPELVLSLAGIGAGYTLLCWKRKPVQ
jgi:hypothetical protein